MKYHGACQLCAFLWRDSPDPWHEEPKNHEHLGRLLPMKAKTNRKATREGYKGCSPWHSGAGQAGWGEAGGS